MREGSITSANPPLQILSLFDKLRWKPRGETSHGKTSFMHTSGMLGLGAKTKFGGSLNCEGTFLGQTEIGEEEDTVVAAGAGTEETNFTQADKE